MSIGAATVHADMVAKEIRRALLNVTPRGNFRFGSVLIEERRGHLRVTVRARNADARCAIVRELTADDLASVVRNVPLFARSEVFRIVEQVERELLEVNQ